MRTSALMGGLLGNRRLLRWQCEDSHGRILKVVHDNGLLIVYANVMPYEDEDDSDDEEMAEDEYGEPGEEDETFEDEDYGDYADCYHTCEDYRAVSEEDWRCVNFCTKCQSCMRGKV